MHVDCTEMHVQFTNRKNYYIGNNYDTDYNIGNSYNITYFPS